MTEIAFRTKALRAICLSKDKIDKRYGAERGAMLRRLLADMRAAECLGDVPLCEVSDKGDREEGDATISVGKGLMLIVTANHRNPPRTKTGSIDWFNVGRILVEQIRYEHD
jgi:hypothetical protein